MSTDTASNFEGMIARTPLLLESVAGSAFLKKLFCALTPAVIKHSVALKKSV
ncbi:hypothetical protein JMG10_20775 [Nostoc ellipsosporum NOK]|nr:hypothetical protein [Nostoc ellipsosporum NOK]